MPQYRRVGHDFTADMENPNPEFWEPVDDDAPDETESTEAATAESEESE